MQQQNFKEILAKMSNVKGWEILNCNDLLALKSPTLIPLVNFVWGEITRDKLDQMKSFYGNNEFYWILSEEQNQAIYDPLNELLLSPEAFPEMLIEINSSKIHINPVGISSIQVKNSQDLQIWIDTAIATFGFSETGFKEFFYPLIEHAGCIPILIYYNGIPAATAMVHCGESAAGIYAMSTKVEYRRKGLGRAAINMCIELAKQSKLDYAVLYSSEDGIKLYNAMGFKVSKKLYEYSFAANFKI